MKSVSVSARIDMMLGNQLERGLTCTLWTFDDEVYNFPTKETVIFKLDPLNNYRNGTGRASELLCARG
jgi:hypothetical protein